MNPVECSYEIYNFFFFTIINLFELCKSELENIEKHVQVITHHKNLEGFKFYKILNRQQTRWSEIIF